jgi:preprotein translocase subunit YajC
MVVTTTGQYATVVEVDGPDVLLEVAPDVVCRFTKAAVGRVVSPPPGAGDGEPPDTGAASGVAIDGEGTQATTGSDDEAETKAPGKSKEL